MNCDLLIKNANIITMDENLPQAGYMAVKEGRILEAGKGDGEHVAAEQVVDLSGKTVLPGLMDCHVHVMIAGLNLNAVDLSGAKTIDEVLSLMGQAASDKPEGEWVFGVSYVPQNVAEGRYPTRFELDSVCGNHYAMIFAATLHGCAVNSKAMPVCDVPEDTPGAEKESGRLTGIYTSDESSFLATANALGSMPDEALWSYIKDCAEHAASKGVTTLHGLFGQFVKDDRDVDLILKRKEELPIEVVVYYQTWNVDEALALGLPRVGGCLTLDGALFECTMANFEPYDSAPALRGVLYHNDEEVYQVVSKAHQAGIQCSMHAVGERAIDQLIYAYYRVIKEQGKKDLRHRIEHFCLPSESQIEMAADLELVLSMQPGFTYLWDRAEGGEFEYMLGRERADRWDPFHRIIERGNIVCGGSDCPVTQIEPLVDIASCVNGFNPVRNIPIYEALKMYTVNAAYAAGLEKTKGSITAGKDADFTVIDRNPYTCKDNMDIYHMTALMTVRKGKTIYSAL